MSKGISSWPSVRRHLTCRYQTPPTWRSPHAAPWSNRSTQRASSQYAQISPIFKLAPWKDGCLSHTSIGLGIRPSFQSSYRRFSPLSVLERHRMSLSVSQATARRFFQSGQHSKDAVNGGKNSKEDSASELDDPKSTANSHANSGTASKNNIDPTRIDPKDQEQESIATSVSKYLNFPALPHRPTKEELLAAANGFWERLKVRFKWVSIRSMRPWNIDEWGAFVSWFMLGHIVWILVGTTTFFSILIFSINTVFAQGTAIII
jgi:hypothetical protein